MWVFVRSVTCVKGSVFGSVRWFCVLHSFVSAINVV